MSAEVHKKLNYEFSFKENLEAVLLDPRFKTEGGIDDGILAYTNVAPVTHATRIEHLRSIEGSGAVMPYSQLFHDRSLSDAERRLFQTDEFDVKLGLGQFTFWSLGRALVQPAECEVILFMDQPDEDEQAVVCMEDIVDLGACVSPEARDQYVNVLGMSSKQVDQDNDRATELFFRSIHELPIFRDILARYIQVNHGSVLDYTSAYEYALHNQLPRENHDIVCATTGKKTYKQPWPGPQVMLGTVDLESVKGAFVIDAEDTDYIRSAVGDFGKEHEIPVYYMLDYVEKLLSVDIIYEAIKSQRVKNPAAPYPILVNNAINYLSAGTI